MTSKLHQGGVSNEDGISLPHEDGISDQSSSIHDNCQKPHRIKIRTITAFVQLSSTDFNENNEVYGVVQKIRSCRRLLCEVRKSLEGHNYEVQTMRIATNPFGEYLLPQDTENLHSESSLVMFKKRLGIICHVLKECEIGFFSVGPARVPSETFFVPSIVATSPSLSCSAILRSSDDIEMAQSIATCMQQISRGEYFNYDGSDFNKENGQNIEKPDYLRNGLGNFRFCMTSNCHDGIPFFPSAKGQSLADGEQEISFAIGLENGELINDLITECGTLSSVKTIFQEGYKKVLEPIQFLCQSVALTAIEDDMKTSGKELGTSYHYRGIDTSINPSLERDGSVGKALETIDVVSTFGGAGTLAIAAELTKAIQSLDGIKKTGYCGLMLPVCEDLHLASLAESKVDSRQLTINDLLCVSSVCGVGLDTVPIPGNTSISELTGVILDVSALSFRWNKSLSCRLLLCPEQKSGDIVRFGSPYMCDCQIFQL